MKKVIDYKSVFSLLLLLIIVELGSGLWANTRDWNAVLIPASLNTDTAVKLVGDQTQMLTLALQATESVRKQSADHDIGLEWDFPQEMQLISNEGVFKQTAFESRRERGRNYFSLAFRVNNANLLGKPGERINSDWQYQSFFVRVPPAISDENAYVNLTLRDKGQSYNWRWPLRISRFNPTKAHPKTNIGLWDYGFYRAGTASDGIADFFRAVGINFTQRASDQVFFAALKKRSITVGGYTHHAVFAAPQATDSRVSGEVLPRQFACPQASLELSPKSPVAGVEELARNALQGDGMAVIDYEPTGLDGFCDKAINRFKEEYKVNADKFDIFRRYFSAQKLQTYHSKDPAISDIYGQWKQFNSQQTSAYIQQIREELRKKAPGVRFGVTTGRSYGANPESVAALGNDNSLLADDVDIIMPQLYFGYDGANVKLLMRYTQGWRETLAARKTKARLWPLLLIRYPGLSQDQPPLRVRQQILGALASGAQGIVIYAPHNLEADHWIAIADTMKEIAAYESFYQQGRRVDDLFKLQDMPAHQAVQNVWPDYKEIIEGPDWAFTAHEWQGNYLLTLFNLGERGDLDFTVTPSQKATLLKLDDATAKGDFKWAVKAGHIGFILLSKQ